VVSTSEVPFGATGKNTSRAAFGTPEDCAVHFAVDMRVNMGSMFLSNEELGKKDDDHKPIKVPTIRPPQWSAATGIPPRKMPKRLAIALALAVFIYLFVSNLPSDVPVRDRRRPVYRPEVLSDTPRAPGPMPNLKPNRKPLRPQGPVPPPAAPPRPAAAAPAASYNGPLVFPKLLSSLQAIYSTGGSQNLNKNVLFAAASLKSAALLLPLACQMGGERRNYVHFALLGGSEVDMAELRAINGIEESCHVIFHGMGHSTAGNCLGDLRS
jgi:hypothetical protein